MNVIKGRFREYILDNGESLLSFLNDLHDNAKVIHIENGRFGQKLSTGDRMFAYRVIVDSIDVPKDEKVHKGFSL